MIKSIKLFMMFFVFGLCSVSSWGNQGTNKRETFKWEEDPLRPSSSAQSASAPLSSKGPGKFRQKVARNVGKGVGGAVGVGAGVAHGVKETAKTAVDIPLQIGKQHVREARQNPKNIARVPIGVAAAGMGVGIGAPIVGLGSGYMKGKDTSKRVSRKVENKILDMNKKNQRK